MTITGGNLVDDFNFVFFQMSLVENKYHGQHGGSSFELGGGALHLTALDVVWV